MLIEKREANSRSTLTVNHHPQLINRTQKDRLKTDEQLLIACSG
jgi:hypothetical protein